MHFLLSPWGPSLNLIVLSLLVIGTTVAILWQEFAPVLTEKRKAAVVVVLAVIGLGSIRTLGAEYLPYDICSQDIPYWLWILYGCWGS